MNPDCLSTWELVKDQPTPITDVPLLELLLQRFPDVYLSELQELPTDEALCHELDAEYDLTLVILCETEADEPDIFHPSLDEFFAQN